MPAEVVDALALAARVGRALEQLGVRYYVAGSVASSAFGLPRATNDIDIVCELPSSRVSELAQALGSDFIVDEEALVGALRRGKSWNIFYAPLLTKIDLFPVPAAEFDRSTLARRRPVPVAGLGTVFVNSPEDGVLAKLRWYRAGGESSDRQWRDVLDVLRTQAGKLDIAHMESWAPEIGVADLLARARAEAAQR